MSLAQESKSNVCLDQETALANAVTPLGLPNSNPQLEGSLVMMPEGGFRAWSVVFGSSLTLFATWGIINSYGVFHKQYTDQILTTSSPSEISLIGALQLFICYGLGPFVGKAFDAHGTKVLLPLGSATTFLSLLLLSFCESEKLYQFMICHGILFGIGNALVFTPALSVASHYFIRRRSLVLGIITAGSGLGGVVFPILLEQLIQRVGFSWAVRVAAFLNLACMLVACVTIRTRLPLTGKISIRNAVDLQGFKDLNYSLSALAAFFVFYALFIPYFYIEEYALFRGIDPTLARYEVAIINAFGIVSRIGPGMVADIVGPLNIQTPMTIISGVLILGLWLPSRDAASITAFSALYGLFSGAFMSLLPSYISAITPREKLGARLGSVYIVVGVASLLGTPTAGAFVPTGKIDSAHFTKLIIFAGSFVISGSIILIAARSIHSRKWEKV